MKKTKDSLGNTYTDYRYILNQKDLSAWEKLAYIIIDQEQPCPYSKIVDCSTLEEESVEIVLRNLTQKGLITNSKNYYYPAFKLEKTNGKARKTQEKEKTTITEKDKDFFLLVKKVEDFHKQQGTKFSLSKKGKKHLRKTLHFLNTYWNNKDTAEELHLFSSKGELYESFVHFSLQLENGGVQSLKRLNYSHSRRSWKNQLLKKHTTFVPHLLKRAFSDVEFYSVLKKEIPRDPKEKGFWTTVELFLLSKWEDKSYPVCKQVLFALERVIVAHIFRKSPVEELIKKHSIYVKEYKHAEMRGVLDNIMDYVQKNEKRSDICYNCNKKGECPSSKAGYQIAHCSKRTVEKVVENGK